MNQTEAKEILADLAYNDEIITDTKTVEALRCGIHALSVCQGKEKPKSKTEIIRDFLECFPIGKVVYIIHEWGVDSDEVGSYQVNENAIYALNRYDDILGKMEDMYDSEEEAMEVWKAMYCK